MSLKKKLSFILLFIPTLICFITFTYAWYVSSVGLNSDFKEVKFYANNSYYAGGDGSESNPYQIANARQLYNLAWLQDLGYYDSKVYYFKLTSNIDMSDLKQNNEQSPIPAIGIDKHPFIGNFNGNGYKIDNLYVSTDFNEAHTDYIKPSKTVLDSHTETYNSGVIQTNYNGLFGVTDIKDKTSSDSASVSCVYNFTISNARIESSKNTLSGFICGYVGNNLSNIGVASSYLDIKEKVEGIDNYSVLTKYGIVGDYNSDTSGIGIEWADSGSGSGQDNDFGGSIDIGSLAKRVTYIKKQICGELNPSGSSSNNTKTYTSTIYNASLYERAVSTDSYKFDFDWSTYDDSIAGKTNSYICLQEGTYFPLNINLTSATIKDENGNDYTDSTTPALGSFYDGTKAETVLSTNTGYVVGYKSATNAYPRIQKQKSEASSSSLGIRYSIGTQLNGTDETDDSKMFASSNFALYMYDTTEGKTKRIEDDDNKTNSTTFDKSGITATYSSSNFAKYSSVKSEFISMLKSSSVNARSNGKLLLEGLRMYNFRSYTFSDNRYTATNSTVSLNGKTYASYQFQNGGFNFTVSKPGIITMILGTYASNSSGHSGLDLYQVTRDSSNNITECDESTRIKQIYTSSDGKEISYNSASGNATNLSIDMDTIASKTGVLSANCAYYFEIPVTAGDYFLSKVTRTDSNSSSLPFVLYLDIGANAGDSGSSSSYIGSIKNIDYTYFKTGSTVEYTAINSDGFTLSKAKFVVESSDTSSLYLYVFRSINDGNYVYYAVEGTNTVTATNATKKDSKDDLHD